MAGAAAARSHRQRRVPDDQRHPRQPRRHRRRGLRVQGDALDADFARREMQRQADKQRAIDRRIDSIATLIDAGQYEQADKIIAVSHYTKEQIIRHYQITGDKIEVVHNGIEPKAV